MARPRKQGLDYFPFDVDFFSDIKVRRIKKDCGAASISVLICLLCTIYREGGYYIKLNEDIPFVVAEITGATEGAVHEIINKAAKVGFFDHSLKEKYGILTSKGIQKRFTSVTRNGNLKRDAIPLEYNLLVESSEETTKKSEENAIPSEEMSKSSEESTQSKEKQSKVNNGGGNNNVSGNNTRSDTNDDSHMETTTNDTLPSELYDADYAAANTAMVARTGSALSVNPTHAEQCGHWLEDVGRDLVLYAIEKGAERCPGRCHWPYIHGVLNGWARAGLTTIALVDAHEKRRDEEKARSGTPRAAPKPFDSALDKMREMGAL